MYNIQFLDSLWSANLQRDKEWNPQKKISLSFRGMELAGEVGELLNELKKLERQQLRLVGSPPDNENLMEELGDVMICLSLICMHLHISPAEFIAATRKKFNKTSDERGLTIKL